MQSNSVWGRTVIWGAVARMASLCRVCAMVPCEQNSINLFRKPWGSSNRVRVGMGRVMNPSAENANVVWFKGKNYNAQVFVGENEPDESVVRRFRKAVMDAGVIAECRRRRFFESPQDVTKRKSQVSRAKRIRRYSRGKASKEERKEFNKETNDTDEDDDYWGGPIDGDVGFLNANSIAT